MIRIPFGGTEDDGTCPTMIQIPFVWKYPDGSKSNLIADVAIWPNGAVWCYTPSLLENQRNAIEKEVKAAIAKAT